MYILTSKVINQKQCDIIKMFLYFCDMIILNDIPSAEIVKTQIIDHFISVFSNNFFIGNEVMYGTKRKLTDLLVLKNDQLIAIEIKTDRDNLRRIEEQISESKKLFDYVVVCTTMTHLEKIKQLLSEDIGIYSVNEHNIKIIRKPKKQKNLDKNEMLFSMNSNYLKKHLNLSSSTSVNLNSDEIRQQYVRKSTTKIHKLFVDYMQQKIQSRFNLFIQNRGENTHVDDIPLLSSPLYIV